MLLEPWNPGTREPWNPGTLEPWTPGSLNPRTLEPWNPGTLEPWNPGTLEPWNPGTLEHSNPGTLEPKNPVCFIIRFQINPDAILKRFCLKSDVELIWNQIWSHFAFESVTRSVLGGP